MRLRCEATSTGHQCISVSVKAVAVTCSVCGLAFAVQPGSRLIYRMEMGSVGKLITALAPLVLFFASYVCGQGMSWRTNMQRGLWKGALPSWTYADHVRRIAREWKDIPKEPECQFPFYYEDKWQYKCVDIDGILFCPINKEPLVWSDTACYSEEITWYWTENAQFIQALVQMVFKADRPESKRVSGCPVLETLVPKPLGPQMPPDLDIWRKTLVLPRQLHMFIIFYPAVKSTNNMECIMPFELGGDKYEIVHYAPPNSKSDENTGHRYRRSASKDNVQSHPQTTHSSNGPRSLNLLPLLLRPSMPDVSPSLQSSPCSSYSFTTSSPDAYHTLPAPPKVPFYASPPPAPCYTFSTPPKLPCDTFPTPPHNPATPSQHLPHHPATPSQHLPHHPATPSQHLPHHPATPSNTFPTTLPHLPTTLPHLPNTSPTTVLHLPNTSPSTLPHLPYTSPTTLLHLPYTSPTTLVIPTSLIVSTSPIVHYNFIVTINCVDCIPPYPKGPGRVGMYVPKCVFPFKWRNITYGGCTAADSDQPWCATMVTASREPIASMYCFVDALKDPAPSRPSPRLPPGRHTPMCLFPFAWSDTIHRQCTRQDRAMPWCATMLSYSHEPLHSVYCTDTIQVPQPNVQPPIMPRGKASPHCLSSFRYKGMEYSGCTAADREMPWCAVMVNEEEEPVASIYCSYNAEFDPFPNQSPPGPRITAVSLEACKFPFLWRENEFSECTSLDAEAPWCPTRLTTTRLPLSSAYCKDYLYGPLPSRAAPSIHVVTVDFDPCILPFVYKGVSYHTCTRMDSPAPWCATTVSNKGFVKRSHYCIDLDDWQLKQSNKPPPVQEDNDNKIQCTFPFYYNGRNYNQCTAVHSSFTWCAVKTNQYYEPMMIAACTKDSDVMKRNKNLPVIRREDNSTALPRPSPLPESDGMVMTMDNGPCVFPFKYKAREYKECACEDAEACWCPTALTDTGEPAVSDYCRDTLLAAPPLKPPPSLGGTIEGESEVRLVGDSMVGDKLSEFYGRSSNGRSKRFCHPGAGQDDITAACDDVTSNYGVHLNFVGAGRLGKLLCKQVSDISKNIKLTNDSNSFIVREQEARSIFDSGSIKNYINVPSL
ncbi:uncharacterized protein LOC123514894 [Portunus trituberculatus]|uniref:uncharacterized protein LOC123514894 n=1 Tax=Portunus trituberculatus TaxID=210409 RepID=UPI001E1CB586|nr:uncharacterized protein LOC123514894 [Portunus trituberculatus]